MKKLTYIIMLLVVMLLLLCSCNLDDNNNNNSSIYSNEVLTALYETNLEFLMECNDPAAAMHYVMDWAKNIEELRVSYDNHNNTIISHKAAEGFQDCETTILHCTVSLNEENKEHSALAMSTVMYILENCQNHGFIRAIFSSENGLEHVKSTYLSADNFISFDLSGSNILLIGSAGTNKYVVSTDITYMPASYTNVFRIELSGIEPMQAEAPEQINAINLLGNLLATCKGDDLLFEIASINGGESYDTYPTSASAIVVVNDNHINKFTKELEDSIEDTLDKYGEINPDMTYSFELAEDIDAKQLQVINHDDILRAIGFIYTSSYGTYEKSDDGEIIAISNTGVVTSGETSLTLEICTKSKSEMAFTSLDSAMQTLCGLYDMNCTSEIITPIWNLPHSEQIELTDNACLNSLIASLKSAFEISPKMYRTFQITPCSVAVSRNPQLNAIAYGITLENMEAEINALFHYLENHPITITEE